jgi:hypothetical protein
MEALKEYLRILASSLLTVFILKWLILMTSEKLSTVKHPEYSENSPWLRRA